MFPNQTGSVSLLGVRVEKVSMTQTLNVIEEMIAQGGFHQVATANVNFLANAERDLELKQILAECDLVVADGMPLVWASRLLGDGLRQRVTGVDLILPLADLSSRRGFGLYFLGSSAERLDMVRSDLERKFPGIRIVGTMSPPPSSLAMMDHEAILADIERARPDILLVALGNPKQEKWLFMHRRRLNVPVAIGVGGSFDMLAGCVRRAPDWIRHIGIEWLYRIWQEPRRLMGRYLRDGAVLATSLPGQILAIGLSRRNYKALSFYVEALPTATVIHLEGELAGNMLPILENQAAELLRQGTAVVLDMAGVRFANADGVGSLMKMVSTASRTRQSLWLARVSSSLRRIISASHAQLSLPQAVTIERALELIRLQQRNGVVGKVPNPPIAEKNFPFAAGQEAMESANLQR